VAAIRRFARALRIEDELATRSADREPLWPIEEAVESNGGVFLSPKSLELVERARKYAASDLPVLITGETGTGKEILANLIHRSSPRAERPLIPFNCATVPRDLIDAHLFGYRKGAFTGAHDSRPGLIRAASGGTLFLDEVGELPLDVQPKLLRVLEHGEVLPLGETKPLLVDVRIVAATNVDLEEQVSSGRFRSDLFYRLDGAPLRPAPLRERREEIPALCQHFLALYARAQKKKPPRLSEEMMEYLLLFNWPGNIRQLANEIRRFVALSEPDEVVGPDVLTEEIRRTRRTVPAGTPLPVADSILISANQPLGPATEQLERMLIARALEQAGGRVDDAARALGLSRKGLYLKRRRLGFKD
jgi:transcriptional regulator with PAS, ATPase and Fis domain